MTCCPQVTVDKLYKTKLIFFLWPKLNANDILAQNGLSPIGKEVHHDENRYSTNSKTCKMSSLTANMRLKAEAHKITTFDQLSNPFVFKCEMDLFRKITVRTCSDS